MPSLPRLPLGWVVAVAALVLSASGGAYAAGLAANSVGTQQLKNHAVTAKKVKNGTLKAKDFAPGTLLQGPAGPVGPAGPQGQPGADGPPGPAGPAGSAEAWVTVASMGGILSSENATGVTATRMSEGRYCISPEFVDDPFGSYVAAIYSPNNSVHLSVFPFGNVMGCTDGVVVYIFDGTNDPYDAPFTLARL
ncbi:hypothetical protein [Nocardioides dilutus]